MALMTEISVILMQSERIKNEFIFVNKITGNHLILPVIATIY